jgi:hypothetical protein
MFHVANEKSHHAPTRGPLRGGQGFSPCSQCVPNMFPKGFHPPHIEEVRKKMATQIFIEECERGGCSFNEV